MPFGGVPSLAKSDPDGSRDGHVESPMPFGGVPSLAMAACPGGRSCRTFVTNAFRRSAFTGRTCYVKERKRGRKVTNAFRRSAFTGHVWILENLCKLPPQSPMPFGGVPSLASFSRKHTASGLMVSPMPFGGVPSLAIYGTDRISSTCGCGHQCLSAECLHWPKRVKVHQMDGAECHQCLSAECLHWPLRNTALTSGTSPRSPMPFGGVPSLAL